MSVESVLARGQAAGVARMTETVMVGVGVSGTDVNLDPTLTIGTEHYAGAAQVKYPSLDVSNADVAGQRAAIASPVLKVPFGTAAAIRTGDLVQVTASSIDPTLVGRRYRIGAWPQSGQVTAHRFPLEEVS